MKCAYHNVMAVKNEDCIDQEGLNTAGTQATGACRTFRSSTTDTWTLDAGESHPIYYAFSDTKLDVV